MLLLPARLVTPGVGEVEVPANHPACPDRQGHARQPGSSLLRPHRGSRPRRRSRRVATEAPQSRFDCAVAGQHGERLGAERSSAGNGARVRLPSRRTPRRPGRPILQPSGRRRAGRADRRSGASTRDPGPSVVEDPSPRPRSSSPVSSDRGRPCRSHPRHFRLATRTEPVPIRADDRLRFAAHDRPASVEQYDAVA